MKGHWCVCRTTKYLGDLYQSLLKGNEKNIKISFSHLYQDNNDIYLSHWT